MSTFGGLSTKFSSRYLVLLSTGELCIYSSKDDFDQRKVAEDVVSLEDVTAKKVGTPVTPAHAILTTKAFNPSSSLNFQN